MAATTTSYVVAIAIIAVWLLLQFVLIRNSSIWSWINLRVVIGLAMAVFGWMNGSYPVLVIGLVFAVLGIARRRRPSPPQAPPSTE